ncbi:MAG: 50S ribosomal protein L11 methyltransferase, partial [Clostridiales bacterium]|nr:50S ribosomal protein L11 methyltransferase [Clostridiales bacterium]
MEEWTEIIIKLAVSDWERAEPIMHMLTSAGFYAEDYSTLEDDVRSIAHIDLISDELIAKDRDTALIHVYSAPGENPGELAAAMLERLAAAGIAAGASMAAVHEEDWANSWKKYFKPLKIGSRILIVPGWEDPPESGGGAAAGESAGCRAADKAAGCQTAVHEGDGERLSGQAAGKSAGCQAAGKAAAGGGRDIVVSIEPGMAFGTGGHASTKLCLELLERHFAPPSPSVLDIGAGSGILSIAAILLGARSALGIDIDKYAVKVARQNAELNGVGDRAVFEVGDLAACAGGVYDIVFANIIADTIIRLLADLKRCLAPGGVFICSGIISDREGDVLRALGAAGLAV